MRSFHVLTRSIEIYHIDIKKTFDKRMNSILAYKSTELKMNTWA